MFPRATLRAANDHTTPNERRFRDRVKKWWFPSTLLLSWIPNAWYAGAYYLNQGQGLNPFVKWWGDYTLAPLKTLPLGEWIIRALLFGPPLYALVWRSLVKPLWWSPSMKRYSDATDPARHEDYIEPAGREDVHKYLPKSVEDARQRLAGQGWFSLGPTGRLIRGLVKGSREEAHLRAIREAVFKKQPDYRPKGDEE